MNRTAIALYIVATVGLMALIVWFGARGATSVADPNDPNRPIAEVIESRTDFGTITNGDIRNKSFIITNRGKSDLILSSVSTSCDCTYVYVTANNQQSPRFTMHGTSSWKGIVKPNESATVEAIYEPAIMPVQGPVERIVTVNTNDPSHSTISFILTANVTN